MALTWITPKTDWKASYDAVGQYEGDYFNVEDYNRIKNNLLFLRELATELFYPLRQLTVGADKHYPVAGSPDFDNDNFFADEINMIENSLEILEVDIGSLFLEVHGDKQTYYDNGLFINFSELNRIESAELELYQHFIDSIAGKWALAIRLGERSNAIRT